MNGKRAKKITNLACAIQLLKVRCGNDVFGEEFLYKEKFTKRS